MGGTLRRITSKDESKHDGHRAHGVFGGLAQGARDHAAETNGILDLQVRGDGPRRGRQRRRRRDRASAEADDRFVIGDGDRGDVGNVSVKRRVDAPDTLIDRGMRGEERFKEARGAREEHVLGLQFGRRGFALRAGEPGDFFQRRGEAERITGELHRGGIGEVFALTGDRGLDEARKEDAAEPDEHHDESGDGHGPGVVLAARTRAQSDADENITQLREGGQTGDGADDAQVKFHVSVADMAELVGDDALQLVAVEVA